MFADQQSPERSFTMESLKPLRFGGFLIVAGAAFALACSSVLARGRNNTGNEIWRFFSENGVLPQTELPWYPLMSGDPLGVTCGVTLAFAGMLIAMRYRRWSLWGWGGLACYGAFSGIGAYVFHQASLNTQRLIAEMQGLYFIQFTLAPIPLTWLLLSIAQLALMMGAVPRLTLPVKPQRETALPLIALSVTLLPLWGFAITTARCWLIEAPKSQQLMEQRPVSEHLLIEHISAILPANLLASRFLFVHALLAIVIGCIGYWRRVSFSEPVSP